MTEIYLFFRIFIINWSIFMASYECVHISDLEPGPRPGSWSCARILGIQNSCIAIFGHYSLSLVLLWLPHTSSLFASYTLYIIFIQMVNSRRVNFYSFKCYYVFSILGVFFTHRLCAHTHTHTHVYWSLSSLFEYISSVCDEVFSSLKVSRNPLRPRYPQCAAPASQPSESVFVFFLYSVCFFSRLLER